MIGVVYGVLTCEVAALIDRHSKGRTGLSLLPVLLSLNRRLFIFFDIRWCDLLSVIFLWGGRSGSLLARGWLRIRPGIVYSLVREGILGFI